MLRLAGVMVVVLLMGAGLERAEGGTPPQNILVAGQTQIATIDMNENGTLNEEDDCVFTGQATPGGGSLNVTGSQAPGPNQARGCTGSCYGTGFTSASQIGVLLDDCEFAGGPFVPLQADFCSTMAGCSSNSPTLAQPAGASPDPVILTFGTLFRTLTQDQAGSGQLCSANGPAIEIIDEDGLRVLRELFPFPEGNPTHMCASNVPVQLENSDGFVNRTACFPSNGGVSPIALSGAPDDPFAIINLNALPPCGGELRGAPTVSQVGLAILLLALLGFGVRTLSRRRGFAEVLPLL